MKRKLNCGCDCFPSVLRGLLLFFRWYLKLFLIFIFWESNVLGCYLPKTCVRLPVCMHQSVVLLLQFTVWLVHAIMTQTQTNITASCNQRRHYWRHKLYTRVWPRALFHNPCWLDKQSGLWSLEWPLRICDLQNSAFKKISWQHNVFILWPPPPRAERSAAVLKFKTTNGEIASDWGLGVAGAVLPAFCVCRQIITILNTNRTMKRTFSGRRLSVHV